MVRCWEESRLKKELVTCQSPEIRRTGQLVRRLDKHNFDQGTPACWISTYFLTQESCTSTLASMRLSAEMLSSHFYVNCIIRFHLVFIHCPLELVTKDFNTGHAN